MSTASSSSDDHDSDPSLPPLHVDRELRKKILSRRKQQRYRKRILADNEGLREHAQDLERELERLKRNALVKKSRADSGGDTDSDDLLPKILSWQDVARALMSDRDELLETNAALKQRCLAYRELIARLGTWAQGVFGLPTAPRTDIHTWRSVTLCADPLLRQEGVEWITQHLYHNTHEMLARYEFPAETAYVSDVDVGVTDADGFQCIHRFQSDIAYALEDAATALRPNVWKFLMVGALISMDPEQADANADQRLFRHYIASADENVNLVSREFVVDADHTVFVGEQIEHDEALPPDNKRQRRRLLWLALDRLAPRRTRLRILFMNSHSFTKQHGYLQLDDEAALWGCDTRAVPGGEDAKIEAFTRHVRQMAPALNQQGQARFVEALTANMRAMKIE
ncbi:Aste57867_14411 [Aphanomyces stellatus]|uniref:Aste57867_14411 protein n=1 Tax=Aphanomyces stellatus TaxID=120398 RepID=A0A485L1E3_9STRA|nr:hypothetical protein As57867_014357 [Aphanomyces stellatus]VFT91233.1 Aste57867_14411 [Aphanomyces stellatus]